MAPSPSRIALSALKAVELKRLAFLAGLTNSGTKAEHLSRLPKELSVTRIHNTSNTQSRSKRILSIDMGIRNLAYCVLDVPHPDTRKTATRTPAATFADLTASRETMPTALRGLKLLAWERTAVSAASAVPATPADGTIALPNDPVSKESFEPATLARLAYALVTSVFLPHDPDVVLIERQRYRSGSAPSILEWTVRVNMFESMLHGVFETLRQQRDSRADPSLSNSRAVGRGSSDFPDVHSVNPKKVSSFWLADRVGMGGEEGKGTAVKKSKEQKEVKIRVAEEWLRGVALTFSGEAATTRKAFLEMRANKKGARRSKKEEIVHDADRNAVKASERDSIKLTKLDDLADCLLQGIAWVQWEINRRKILELVDVE